MEMKKLTIKQVDEILKTTREQFKKDYLAKYANQWSGIEKHKLPKICL